MIYAKVSIFIRTQEFCGCIVLRLSCRLRRRSRPSVDTVDTALSSKQYQPFICEIK